MLPQAGLALSLAVLFESQFQQLGHDGSALIFGVVTLNELVCPVLYRLAIVRSGEAFREPDSDTQPLTALAQSA